MSKRSKYQYQVACLDGVGGRLNMTLTLPEGYHADFDAVDKELSFFLGDTRIAHFTGVFFFIRSEVEDA